jgi:mono/diheme cytochrome c family protein
VVSRKAIVAVLAVGGIVVVGGLISWLGRRTARPPEYGRDLYTQYCASCHGVAGKGDGPASGAMQPPPTDLTRLRERYGTAYPLREVMSAIDGRYPVRAHGSSEMPVWGYVFEREMEEQGVRSPRQTTLHQVRLISEYVLGLQE